MHVARRAPMRSDAAFGVTGDAEPVVLMWRLYPACGLPR